MNKFWTSVIVVAIIAGAVWYVKNGTLPLPVFTMTSASPTAAAQASKAPSGGKKAATPMPTQSLSYTQLVQAYGDNRIQFDQNCQAQPRRVVLKSGTSIMIDNRSDQARTISVNGTTYALGPYGYQTLTLSSSSVPRTIQLGCNSLVNVGTVQLEANISGQ